METKTTNSLPRSENSIPATKFSRRSLLQAAAGVSAIAGMTGSATAAPKSKAASNGHPVLAGNRNHRSAQAMQIRNEASRTWLQDFIGTQETNGDEGLYPDYRASFTKALPHNDIGEVVPSEYEKLLTALESRRNADFEAITLGGARKLANPQGAYKFDMVGRDAHNTFMRPAPVFSGTETAAEMGELYWKALCRDVPFSDFGTNPLISSAVSDLNAFSETVGPNNCVMATSNIFRGETAGDLVGPDPAP